MATLSKLYRGDAGDEYKSVGLRLEAYDVDLLTQIFAHCDSKNWDALMELVRAQRPLWKDNPKDNQRWKARVDKIASIVDAGSLLWNNVVEPELAKFDPFSFLERALEEGTLEEHHHAASNLAIRDRVDIDIDTSEVLGWLTELVNGVKRNGLYNNPDFFGARHFKFGDEVVWASNEFGCRLPNFFAAEDLARPLAKLEELRAVKLFELEEEWKEVVTSFHSASRRILMVAREEEGEAARAEILANADWAFVTAMHKQRMLYKKLQKFYERAQKKGWGVFAYDALDP